MSVFFIGVPLLLFIGAEAMIVVGDGLAMRPAS